MCVRLSLSCHNVRIASAELGPVRACVCECVLVREYACVFSSVSLSLMSQRQNRFGRAEACEGENFCKIISLLNVLRKMSTRLSSEDVHAPTHL